MSGGFVRRCAGIVFTSLVVVLLARGAATSESATDEQVIVVTSRAIRQAAVFHQEPEYPPAARQFRLSGEVVVELTVGVDGKVENVEVTKGRPILNEAVTRAIRKWSFSPFMVEGHPRKVKSTLSFNFQL
jgi:TonB family protein